MTPSVSNSKTDGNIGVAVDTDKIAVVIGCASSGAFDTPTSFTDKNDVKAAHTSGGLVEALCYLIAAGIPCVGIRSNPTTPGAFGTIDVTGVTGTSVVTNGVTTPDHEYDVIVKITNGGTRGIAGITFIFSLDAGVNWSDPQALGTATTLTCARGVSFALAAGTLVTGDVVKVTTNGPRNLSVDVADSLTALSSYASEWFRVLVVSTDADATIIAQLESFAKSFWPEGKNPEMFCCTRARGAAESRSAYVTAMGAIASAVQTTETSVWADQCEIVSELDGRRLRMAASIGPFARHMLINDSVDSAAKSLGALPGVFVTTAATPPVRAYHDEFRFPGLDALGFSTLRTWGGRPITPGTYVNNPRVMSGPGSDYRYFQHTAVANRIIEETYKLLQPRLSEGVLCDPTTGKIREDVAKAIDDSMNADLVTRFVDSKMVSAVKFTLSRTDNVLATDTIGFKTESIPLAYVKKFIGKSGLAKTIATT